MVEFVQKLFDASDFPARWHCGTWSEFHGWLYIGADTMVALAYFAIPLLIAALMLRRDSTLFPRIGWLFVAFILACGITHMMDVMMFWYPAYRLNALTRVVTAMVSWATVIALLRVLPVAMMLKTPSQLAEEVAHRTAELDAERLHSAQLARTLEDRVEQRTAALARSNRDLERFAFVASHDLLEPARQVGSYADLFTEEFADQTDPRGLEYLRYVTEGAHRAQQMLEGLMRFATVEGQGKSLVPTDSAACLEAARRRLGATIGESGASIEASGLPWVLADPTQLVDVFAYLLDNCLKFRTPDAPPHVHVHAERDGSFQRFVVRDDGIGFDPRFEEAVFGLFKRLHHRDEVDGLGVGLAIVRRIVERHGGEISARSAPGGGTSISFTLPAAEAP